MVGDWPYASVKSHEYDMVLAIGEPGGMNYGRGRVATSCNAFHDCSLPNPSYVYPTRPIMEGMLESIDRFLADDRCKTILVHCFAGVSRSTAAALTVLLRDGWSVKDAAEYVFKIRPIADPNRLMLGYIDQMFDLHGELHEIVSRLIFERTSGQWRYDRQKED